MSDCECMQSAYTHRNRFSLAFKFVNCCSCSFKEDHFTDARCSKDKEKQQEENQERKRKAKKTGGKSGNMISLVSR